MKRALLSTCAVLGLAAAGIGHAAPNPYLYGSSGADFGITGQNVFSFGIGAGTGNVFGDIGARGELNLAFGNGVVLGSLEGNLIVPVPQRDYNPYFGGGVTVGVNSFSGGTQFGFGVQALLGVDFLVGRNGRIFVEAVPAYTFAGDTGFKLGARAGIKINL